MAKDERAASEQVHLQLALGRFAGEIEAELRHLFVSMPDENELDGFYGQMAYHLGWRDADLQPAQAAAGKMLRPGLVLWACELALAATEADASTRAARHQQALAVAASVELVHNFSLIHDDIEDRDRLRRGRPTNWTLWGEAQTINVGDGMFALARLALWRALPAGLSANLAVQLAALLDQTCLRLCEGQHRDMTSEARATVTPTLYLDTITRKTAALMRTACEMGGRVGAPEDRAIGAALADFGEALGIAFQLRDDLLGIWAASDISGKVAAGDLRRKKMSLPVIQALAVADDDQREELLAIYQAAAEPNEDEIARILAILDHTEAHAWCRARLADYCEQAQAALHRACGRASASEAAQALGALVAYVAIAAQG